MKNMILIAMLVTGLAGVTQAAPLNQAQVPAGAVWVAHIDVDQLRATRLGEMALGKLLSDTGGGKMDALAAVLGFDVRKDIGGCTIYGTSCMRNQGVCILAGRFDEPRILALVKANETYQALNYGGIVIHNWVDARKHNKSVYLVMLPGLAAMASSDALMKSAVDVLLGWGDSLKKETRAGLSVPAVESGAFFVAAASVSESKKLPNAKSGSMVIAEAGDELTSTMNIVADSAQGGQDMAAKVKGFIAMMQMNLGSDEKARALASGIQVVVDGACVRVEMKMPAQDAADIVKRGWEDNDRRKAEAKARKAAAAAAAVTP